VQWHPHALYILWHSEANMLPLYPQVHLGFFATEAAAARAYDRAALAKAAQLGGSMAHVQTNFDSQLYRCACAFTCQQRILAMAAVMT
jgi:hypothetical protein